MMYRQIFWLAAGFFLSLLGGFILILDALWLINSKSGFMSILDILFIVDNKESITSLQLFIQNNFGFNSWPEIALPFLNNVPAFLVFASPGAGITYSGIKKLLRPADDRNDEIFSTDAFLKAALRNENKGVLEKGINGAI